MKPYFLPGLSLLLLLTSPVSAQISGLVFDDANANRKPDLPRERGLARVRVLATDRLGQPLASTSTDSSGYYRFPPLAAQAVRLEFGPLPAHYHPTQGQYLTRFLPEHKGQHDLGLYRPDTYTGDTPRVAVTIQPIGSHHDPRNQALNISTIRLLQTSQPGGTDSLRVPADQTGCIWGLAHDPTRNCLYAAALAKRHSGYGPLGAGGIYQTNLATGLTRPFCSLDALGIQTGPEPWDRALGDAYEAAMTDSLMFSRVGKMGLGGIDLSDDGHTLYALNLHDRNLYALHLPATGQPPVAGDVNQLALPVVPCQGGDWRPFAVKCHQGQVYVGGVCDAARSGRPSDLRGYVYALDPATGHSREVVSLPLNYKRGAVEYGIGDWFAWTDETSQVMLAEPAWWAVHPQPMLSDLEFDTDGSLLIGLMDRLGHQMVTGKGTPDGRWRQVVSLAAGDVLRTTPRRNAFRLEANAKAGDSHSVGIDNKQGPAGGEFYYEDDFSVGRVLYHQENGMGGLALLPGERQLLVSSREPTGDYNSAGIVAYQNQTGKKVRGLTAYRHNPAAEYVGRKTNHVGDVELIRATPPTLLGHRVWQDCDEDGLQDADETGLSGIRVELWQGAHYLATTQTDSLGYYGFDSRQQRGGFETGAAYQLRVAYNQPGYRVTNTFWVNSPRK